MFDQQVPAKSAKTMGDMGQSNGHLKIKKKA